MQSLTFAVFGTGRFGQHYVRLLNEVSGAELAATVSRSRGPAEAVFTDPKIECVVIATPATTHFDLIQKALAAGKHVLVEKPMVVSVTEAELVRDLVQKSSKVEVSSRCRRRCG